MTELGIPYKSVTNAEFEVFVGFHFITLVHYTNMLPRLGLLSVL